MARKVTIRTSDGGSIDGVVATFYFVGSRRRIEPGDPFETFLIHRDPLGRMELFHHASGRHIAGLEKALLARYHRGHRRRDRHAAAQELISKLVDHHGADIVAAEFRKFPRINPRPES